MDILDDLIRESGVRRRLLGLPKVPHDRALRFPCDRSLGFHLVLEGTLYLHSMGHDEPLVLEAGDIAVMGRGCDHLLTTRAERRGLPVHDITLAPPTLTPANAADGGVSILSGAYQLWHTPVHPFFLELPEWFVLRGARTVRLGPVSLAVAMITEEAQRVEHAVSLGRSTVVHGLLDVLFTYLLREIVAQRDPALASWSTGIRDSHVRQVLGRMHEAPEQDWTLDGLAREVGLSRSVLAERFRTLMGEPPLSYLRTVRLQRAMRLLAEGDQTLQQVAVAVGYQDAFSFSKAFKKAVGQSPGEFRRRDKGERDLPWRLGPNEAVAY